MDYASYPAETVQDIVRLRRRIAASGLPPRSTDHNLIVGTWNVRAFGRLYPHWDENPDSPKRNLRGLACIAEVVRHFDVIAIQEVLRDTEAIRALVAEFLGPSWRLILSDATAGDAGNAWFMGDHMSLQFSGSAGTVDFAGAVFQHLGQQAMTYRVSDHFPLWAEFLIDHSDQHMARTLNLDPYAPDPFAGVPD